MKKTGKFNSIFIKTKEQRGTILKEPSVESIIEEDERTPSPEPEPKKVEKAKKKVTFKE